MKRKYFVKGAGAIFVALLFLVSTAAVFGQTTNNTNLQTNVNGEGSANGAKGEIVWDNGMDYTGLAAAQDDAAIPFDCFLADDFLFEEPTEVCDVHWVGGYWNGNPAEFNWGISFYLDDGTGNSPVGLPYTPSFAGPFIFTWAQVNPVEIEPGYYEMSVDLPENIPFPPGHYWISIWGIGNYPPQSGWGYHQTFLLTPAVWGSVYFGFSFWTPGYDVQGFDHDCCFQLTTKTQAIPAICCEGDLNWVDVPAGATVTGFIEVCNCGEDGSFLNWEVLSWPDWGTWTFEPASGTGLAEGDCVTINVSVVAPDEENAEFAGKVILQNSDNPDDTCALDVSLVTPRPRFINSPFLLRILERFENLFAILKFLF